MSLPAYESPLYDDAIELIHVDINKLHAYHRTVWIMLEANTDRLIELRNQLKLLVEDAIEEVKADDHGDIF